MLEVEERVNHLDELMAQLIQTVTQTSKEFKEFKEEMREFKEEMREFKEESRLARERSEREMEEFKKEMLTFQKESRQRWGELARKMGTMAEDLVAPSVPEILRVLVGCERIEYQVVRFRRLHQGREQEFDVVAMCGDYVLINETKSTLRPEHITEFGIKMQTARDFFPEFAQKKFIGAIASLYVDKSLVSYGEKQGLIVLGFGENVMEVLNTQGFKPKTF